MNKSKGKTKESSMNGKERGYQFQCTKIYGLILFVDLCFLFFNVFYAVVLY